MMLAKATMTTKLPMDVEEYLHTSFEGADCDYLHGEVVERNLCELGHADVQGNLYQLLRKLRRTLGIRVVPEIRIQIHARPTGPPTSPYGATTTSAPESPRCRRFWRSKSSRPKTVWSGCSRKSRNTWRLAWSTCGWSTLRKRRRSQDPRGSICEILRTQNPDIEIPLEAAFDLDA
jgi:hypothetical protein